MLVRGVGWGALAAVLLGLGALPAYAADPWNATNPELERFGYDRLVGAGDPHRTTASYRYSGDGSVGVATGRHHWAYGGGAWAQEINGSWPIPTFYWQWDMNNLDPPATTTFILAHNSATDANGRLYLDVDIQRVIPNGTTSFDIARDIGPNSFVLTSGRTYYWQVYTSNADGNNGDVWTFTANQAPNRANLIWPPDPRYGVNPPEGYEGVGVIESYRAYHDNRHGLGEKVVSPYYGPTLLFTATDPDGGPGTAQPGYDYNIPFSSTALYAQIFLTDKKDPWEDPGSESGAAPNRWEITDFVQWNFAADDVANMAGPFYQPYGHYRPALQSHASRILDLPSDKTPYSNYTQPPFGTWPQVSYLLATPDELIPGLRGWADGVLGNPPMLIVAREPLQTNRDYLWRVRLFDGDLFGEISPTVTVDNNMDMQPDWPAEQTGITQGGFQQPFAFRTVPNNLPEPAYQPNPPDYRLPGPPAASMNVATSPPPTLTWKWDEPDGQPVTFDVYFGTEFNPSNGHSLSAPPLAASNLTQAKYTPSSLRGNKRYFWRVVTRDSQGRMSVSTSISADDTTTAALYMDNAPWSFLTNNQVPSIPGSETPDDPVDDDAAPGDPNSHGVGSLNQKISWNCTDPENDTIYYDVYFGTDPTPDADDGSSERVAQRVTTNGWQPDYRLTTGTLYYWRVVAYNIIEDASGQSIVLETVSSPVWNFVAENAAPQTPSNPSPANGATGVAVQLELNWTCADPEGEPVRYTLEFDDPSTGPSPDHTIPNIVSNSYVISGPGRPQYDPALDPMKTYQWRITATDGTNATQGPWWTFTTGTNAPSFIRDGELPRDGDTTVSPDTTQVSWQVTDPDNNDGNPNNNQDLFFDVYFGRADVYGNKPPKVQSGIMLPAPAGDAATQTMSWSINPPLEPEVRYVWRVEVLDEANRIASPLWEFITVNRAPSAPTLVRPAHGSTNVARPTTLQWNSVDPDGDQLTYTLFWGTVPNPGRYQSDLLSDTYTIPANETAADTLYYWRVEASDGRGHVVSSDADAGTAGNQPWTFRTVPDNRYPNVPTDFNPPDGATGISTLPAPTLSWTCTDPDGDTLSYDVAFGNSPTPPTVSSGQAATSYTPAGPLLSMTEYFWRITAYDGRGGVTTGPVLRFTTGNLAPGAPTVVYPADGQPSVPDTLTLRWNCSDPENDTLTYRVYLGTDRNNLPALDKDNNGQPDIITTTQVDVGPLTQGATYYWRVGAHDPYTSTLGPIWSFVVDRRPVFDPTRFIPPDLSTGVQTSPPPTLTWQCSDPDGDPIRYYVAFGTSDPPPIVDPAGQTANSYAPPMQALIPDTTYYWRITAEDLLPNGTGITQTVGPVLRFSTGDQAAGVPYNPNPADGATQVSLTPTLTWQCDEPEGESLVYDVYFGTDPNPPLRVQNRKTEDFAPGTLEIGTRYYWRVGAKDAPDAVPVFGPVWTFWTLNNSPNVPVLVFPADGAHDVLRTVVLQWTATDPDGQDLVYNVAFGTSNPPSVRVTGLEEDHIAASDALGAELQPAVTYYWQITAVDPLGAATTGPVWSFTTINFPPELSAGWDEQPPTGSIARPSALLWNTAVDPEGGPVTYDVYFGSKKPIPVVAQGISTTDPNDPSRSMWADVPTLTENTTYYWRVVAIDQLGGTTTSAEWSFTTPDLFSVSGTVRNAAGNAPIAGVRVNLEVVSVTPPTEGPVTFRPVSTDANGHYEFPDVPAGNYRVVLPATDTINADWTFEPESGDAGEAGWGQTDVAVGPNAVADFVATRRTYTISGTVTVASSLTGPAAGDPLPGATVRVLPDDVTAVTDASGHYTIDGLWSGGKTVTATMPEYTFNGPFTVVLPPNQTVDFQASQKTYSIAGKVYDYEDNPLGLVTVTAGAYSAQTIDPTVVPAQGGQFTIQPVPAGTYSVTPTLNNLTFDPAFQSVTVNETVGNASGLVFRQIFVPEPTTITIDPTTATAQPRSSTAFTARVLDQEGDPIEGVHVLVNATGDSIVPITNQDLVTDEQGQVTFSVQAQPGTLGEATITAQAQAFTPITATAKLTVAWSLNLTPPASARKLRLITVPGTFDPSTLSSPPPIARYDAAAGQYVAYGSGNFVLEPGQGYFVQVASAVTFGSSTGSLFDQGQALEIPVGNGWVLLGNPRYVNLKWSLSNIRVRSGGATMTLAEAVAAGLIEPYGWAWDADTDQYVFISDSSLFVGATDTLRSLEAMYIRTLTDGLTIILPAAGGAAAAPSVSGRGASDWITRITARAGDKADTENFIGVTTSPLTRGGVRVSSPPPMGTSGKSIDLSFASQGATGGLAVDLRGAQEDTMVWRGLVRTTGVSGDVSLTWGDLKQIPREYSISLTDLQTNKRVSMRTAAGYTFSAPTDGSASAREIEIRLERRVAAGLQVVLGATEIRSRGAAFDASIRYTLTQDATVTCVVKNAAGRVIRTLPPIDAAAGVNTLSWNGRTDEGSAVPPGQYMIEIRAATQDGQRASGVRSLLK